MSKILRILLLTLPLLILAHCLSAQVKGESGLKWYSWHASGGFMLPADPFSSEVISDLQHNYRFSGIPGYTFSIAKPLTIKLNVGWELQDIIVDGKLAGPQVAPETIPIPGAMVPANNLVSSGNASSSITEPYYNTRMRTYNLYAQYYFLPNTNINHFIMGKVGYSRINQGLEGKWDPTRSLHKKDLWDWVFTAAYGVTWHAAPNFSVNLYGEFSPTPDRYLGEIYDFLKDPEKSNMPMGRIVLSLTGHTDIRVFFPFSKARKYTTRYKPDKYLPFYRVRKRDKDK
jgi:opacity protein-like surface antigen